MARRGEAPLALGLSAASEGIGGLAAGIAMLLLTPLLASLALSFGPLEYIALIIFSLVIVSVMLSTPLIGNLLASIVGSCWPRWILAQDTHGMTATLVAVFSVLGLILGLLFEENLVVAQSIVRDWTDVFQRPIALFLFAISAVLLAGSIFARLKRRRGM